MFELLQKGGFIMVLILLLSLIATVIIIERLLFFRRIRVDEEKMIARLRLTLEKARYEEAMSICENAPSPITNLMRVGIEHRGLGENEIKEAIMNAANLEIPRLERFLPALGTVAHIAPLLGLLGTVTGIIKAFGVLGQFVGGGDPRALASGIAEALLTTAAGIVVAVPAIIFYNYLVSKVNHIIIRLENRVSELVLLLRGRTKENAIPKAVES